MYAGLKDYFASEFEVTETVGNTDELRAVLVRMNESADTLLSSCRFAVEEGFIDNDFKLKAYDTVVIIPPSSGG